MCENKEKVKILKDWPQPETGAPKPCIYSDDTEFVVMYFTSNAEVAVITFPMVSIFKSGIPNDEVLSSHPLYQKGLTFYGVHSVKNSSWIRELEKQNSVHPQHNKNIFLKDMHHYIFTFHDTTLELVVTEGEFWKPVIHVSNSYQEAKEIFIKSTKFLKNTMLNRTNLTEQSD